MQLRPYFPVLSRNKQMGSSLVELMIGIAVSLILLAGVVTMVVRLSVSGGETVQSARLNQQLRSSMDQMSKELQRAGYVRWDSANGWQWAGGVPTTNPYTADEAVDPDGLISDYNARDFYVAVASTINTMGNITINGSCILFTYDIDGDGAQSDDSFENFGFRLNDGAIEKKVSGAHSCDDGGWQDVTGSDVTITGLTFNMNYISANNAVDGDSARYQFSIPTEPNWNCWTVDTDDPPDGVPDVGDGDCDLDSDGDDAIDSEWPDADKTREWPGDTRTACTPSVAGVVPTFGDTLCFIRRGITITLSGRLANDANVTMTLTTLVKVKNDHFHVSGNAG